MLSLPLVAAMKHFVALVAISSAAILAVMAEDRREAMIPEYMAAAMDCVKDYEMDFTVCKEMLKDGADLSQAKYEPCKCVPACIAKKKKAMKESGEFDLDQMAANVEEMGYEPWVNEYKRVVPLCKDSFKGKVNCDAAAAFAVCGWKNSEMMRTTIGQYMGQMDD